MKALTDNLINAYIDGELNVQTRAEVEALIANDAQVRSDIEQAVNLKKALHKSLDPVLSEPIPARLRERPYRQPLWQPALAGFAMLFLGVFVGWVAKPQLILNNTQAIGAHIVYANDARHPVEVDASQEQHLVTWLSKRLGRNLQAPNLNRFGFVLLGGRLMAEGAQPAAQLMYERDDGLRISLYISPVGSKQEIAEFKFVQEQNLNAFFWSDKQTRFTLVGSIDRNLLQDMAHSTYQQLAI